MKHPAAAALAVALSCLMTWPALAEDGTAESYDCIVEPSRVLDVGSAAVGVLQEVRVERSDTVQAGQVLAVLESGVEAATVDLASLRASIDTEVLARGVTFEFQRNHQARTERLHATRAVAEHARDEAEHDARLSALRLRQAREEKRLAELELIRAEHALARRTIRSPVAGVVMERHKSPGERVEDQAILRIAQLHPLRVEVVLPVERYGDVRKGMQARVRPQYGPGGEFVAQVTAIDPVLDAASSTFGVRLSMPNPDHAVPGGLRCTLEFMPEAANRPATSASGSAPETAREDAPVAEPVPETARSEPAAPVPAPEVASGQASTTAPTPAAAPVAAPTPVAADEIPRNETPTVSSTAAAADTASTGYEPLAPSAVHTGAAGRAAITCLALGPIEGKRRATRLRDAFAAQDLDTHVLHLPVAVAHGYLVAVDASESTGTAASITARLRREGLEDFHVLTRPPGRVSVGVFTGPNSAEARAKRVQAIGLPARIHPRTREQVRYFLEIPGLNAPDQRALVPEVLASEGLAELEQSACDRIVTAAR